MHCTWYVLYIADTETTQVVNLFARREDVSAVANTCRYIYQHVHPSDARGRTNNREQWPATRPLDPQPLRPKEHQGIVQNVRRDLVAPGSWVPQWHRYWTNDGFSTNFAHIRGGSRWGHRGHMPLQTHGQQKWSGQSEHDLTKIRAVQFSTALKTKLIQLNFKYHVE